MEVVFGIGSGLEKQQITSQEQHISSYSQGLDLVLSFGEGLWNLRDKEQL